MAIVGYGEERGVKYWKLKNSWGSDMAEGGYIKIERGVNYCNVSDLAFELC